MKQANIMFYQIKLIPFYDTTVELILILVASQIREAGLTWIAVLNEAGLKGEARTMLRIRHQGRAKNQKYGSWVKAKCHYETGQIVANDSDQ